MGIAAPPSSIHSVPGKLPRILGMRVLTRLCPRGAAGMADSKTTSTSVIRGQWDASKVGMHLGKRSSFFHCCCVRMYDVWRLSP
jgi:hypothetical protein